MRDPSKELNELHCRTNPLSRAYMTGGFFQDRLWLFGGRRGKDDLWQDSWYRYAENKMVKPPFVSYFRVPFRIRSILAYVHVGQDMDTLAGLWWWITEVLMNRSAVPGRDEHIPFAYLTTTPKSKSATSIFRAKSDKEGVHFEYKVYMIDLFTDVSLSAIRAVGMGCHVGGTVSACGSAAPRALL